MPGEWVLEATALCRSCQAPLPTEARFCPRCGVAAGTEGASRRGQIFGAATLLLELVLMAVVGWWVVPRFEAQYAQFSPQLPAYLKVVFSSWWTAAWMVVVAIVGAPALKRQSGALKRGVILGAASAVGFVGMLITVVGLYISVFAIAEGIK